MICIKMVVSGFSGKSRTLSMPAGFKRSFSALLKKRGSGKKKMRYSKTYAFLFVVNGFLMSQTDFTLSFKSSAHYAILSLISQSLTNPGAVPIPQISTLFCTSNFLCRTENPHACFSPTNISSAFSLISPFCEFSKQSSCKATKSHDKELSCFVS